MDHTELIRKLRFLKVKSPDGNALVRQAAGEIERMACELAEVKVTLEAAVGDLRKHSECDTCLHEGNLDACSEDWECLSCSRDCYCKLCREGSLWEWRGCGQGGTHGS